MRMLIYRGTQFAQGAQELRDKFDCWINPRKRAMNRMRWEIVLNWGCTDMPVIVTGKTVNPCMPVRNAVDKRSFYTAATAAGVRIPPVLTKEGADEVLKKGGRVLKRTLMRASRGRGITVLEGPDADLDGGVLVKYIPKKAEYRVHVVNGKVIDVQQKKKRRGFEGNRNNAVRSYENGWVYCRGGVNPPADVINQGLAAVQCLVLDFGAADVIWNEKQQQAYALEVNTAPGIEGTTVEKYFKALQELING